MADVTTHPAVDAVSRGMIVVVDDDFDICESIDEVLSHEGYRVLTVPNGLRLLTTLAEKKPDLILLDVNMPAVNGFDLCRALKRNPEFCHIPVVLMSARLERDDVLAGTMGAVKYLHKPFDLQELTNCVRDEMRKSGPQAAAELGDVDINGVIVSIVD